MLNISKKGLVFFIITTFLQSSFSLKISAQITSKYQVKVTIDAKRPVKTFDPNRDLGAGIDGHDFGEIDQLLSTENIKQMLTTGFKPISYRLRTELANEVWHWNPQGTWSDAENERGYWTSNAQSDGDISLCYGYKLPRRGNTIDQADNEGYSRIDDGDADSFWKSNPYLDEHFTGENNRLHQQWIVIDLGAEKTINAIKILWGTPFAARYEIQYGKVADISDISQNPPELWHTFQNGKVETKIGGEIQTKLSDKFVKTRYLRVLLKQSSETAPKNSTDVRDGLGYAVREIYVGSIENGGHFKDEIRHGAAAKKQTEIYVSSTDPWHRAGDIDRNTEHIGFDRLYKSGLTNDMTVLIPVGLLYDTPENAAAEIAYLKAKNYKFERVEMGEEPDGQNVAPEDFAALYVQWTNAIHKIAPEIKLGGPSFQEIEPDTRGYKTELGNPVWFERFINYLEERGRADDFSFFSFEWYPFDEVCRNPAAQLVKMPSMLVDYINVFRKHGLKTDVPLVISEYGFSAFSAEAEVDLEGAIFNADTIGKFLSIGGAAAYLYGYEPNHVERDFPCTAGNNMLFLGDDAGKIKYKTATYFGAQLLMREWLESAGGEHQLFSVEMKTEQEKSVIDAYAVKRPDKKWAIMLINKSPKNAWTINIRFTAGKTEKSFIGDVDFYQFSSKQYQWNAKLARPTKSEPPEHKIINSNNPKNIKLPPYSLTVLRGSVD